MMNPTSFLRRASTLLALTALALAACSGREAPPAPAAPAQGAPPPAPSAPAPARVLTVFAAASLRESFTQIVAEFERTHAGVTVQLNFAGTQELRTQIEHGARADVLASADQHHMNALAQQRKVGRSRTFAHNEPVIAVPVEPSGSAAQPGTLADLVEVKRLVIAAPEVPLGRYTLQILQRGSIQYGPKFEREVTERVVSRELNAPQVLAKVSLGEADAAIVYRTDVLAAGDKVRAVPIAANLNVLADYPIAVVSGAPQPELAEAFVALVLADRGQGVLERAGFSRAGSVTARQ